MAESIYLEVQHGYAPRPTADNWMEWRDYLSGETSGVALTGEAALAFPGMLVVD